MCNAIVFYISTVFTDFEQLSLISITNGLPLGLRQWSENKHSMEYKDLAPGSSWRGVTFFFLPSYTFVWSNVSLSNVVSWPFVTRITPCT